MKLTRRIACSLLPLLLLTCSGCVTHALWKNDNLEAFNQPAENPNLRLFDAKQKKDVLVVYDEHSERSGKSRTRAYWLNENEERVEQRHRPHFVSVNSACEATPILILPDSSEGANSPPAFYAVIHTDEESFTLFSNGEAIKCYKLPFYNDGRGAVEKFILTPPAVTADTAIVGTVLGLFYLEAQAGAAPSFPDWSQ